jgi:hypothetical protein
MLCMRKLLPSAWLAAALLGAVATTAVPTAAHALDCADLPNPVYGLGGNAIKPLLKQIGTVLSAASDAETIVYQGPGQCFGINGLLDGTAITGTAIYFDAEGTEQSCDLPIAGVAIEFAGLNTFGTTCPGVDEIPDSIGDFPGPAQSVDFIVPIASTQSSISAEAAYFVYGFGEAGQASPWTDELNIFKRDPNAIVLLTALAIDVPVEKLKGVDAESNGNTVTLVSTSEDPESAIGIVAGEVAQANRDVVKTLAYQHYGQTCGYWPDSTANGLDKRNIRDGHYFIWANTHFYAEVDGDGVPVLENVARLFSYFSGETPLPGTDKDIRELQIKAGTVPDCAMEVKRSSDLGDVEVYAPDEPCGCFFDSVATGETDCDACEDDDACPEGAPNCRYGFCEVN